MRLGRKLFFSFAAVALVLAFLTVGLEVALRIAGYNPLASIIGGRGRGLVIRESSHPEVVYEPAPNSAGRVWDCDVSINSSGFRDRDYELPKPDDCFRVVAIGDSITFGIKLDVHESFPEQLENLFLDSPETIEVLNLGVCGYSTLQEVAFLEHVGLQFQPDLVILAYCFNDVTDNSPEGRYIVRVQQYDSLIFRSRIIQFIAVQLDRLEQESAVASRMKESTALKADDPSTVSVSGDAELKRLMRDLSQHIDNADESKDHRQLKSLELYTSEKSIGKMRYAFQRLAQLRDRHGFRVAVIAVPYLDDRLYSEAWQSVYRIVEHESARLDFEMVDVYQAMAKEGLSRLCLSEKDRCHPNPRGHEIIAQCLHKWIIEKRASSGEAIEGQRNSR